MVIVFLCPKVDRDVGKFPVGVGKKRVQISYGSSEGNGGEGIIWLSVSHRITKILTKSVFTKNDIILSYMSSANKSESSALFASVYTHKY